MDADNVAFVDELRQAAPLIPPSHVPTAAELLGVVGALIAAAEFGEGFFEAVKSEDPAAAVGALWTPEGESVEPAPQVSEVPAAGPGTPLSPAEDPSDALAALQAENDELRQQLQTQLAQQGRTTVDVAPGTDPAGRTTVTPGDTPRTVDVPPGATI